MDKRGLGKKGSTSAVVSSVASLPSVGWPDCQFVSNAIIRPQLPRNRNQLYPGVIQTAFHVICMMAFMYILL